MSMVEEVRISAGPLELSPKRRGQIALPGVQRPVGEGPLFDDGRQIRGRLLSLSR